MNSVADEIDGHPYFNDEFWDRHYHINTWQHVLRPTHTELAMRIRRKQAQTNVEHLFTKIPFL